MPVNRLSLRKKENPNGVSEGFTLLLDKRPVGEWQTPDYGKSYYSVGNSGIDYQVVARRGAGQIPQKSLKAFSEEHIPWLEYEPVEPSVTPLRAHRLKLADLAQEATIVRLVSGTGHGNKDEAVRELDGIKYRYDVLKAEGPQHKPAEPCLLQK